MRTKVNGYVELLVYVDTANVMPHSTAVEIVPVGVHRHVPRFCLDYNKKLVYTDICRGCSTQYTCTAIKILLVLYTEMYQLTINHT